MITAILCATVGVSHADPEVLFNEGRAFLDAGDYERGCPKFEQAYEERQSAGIEANLGICAEHFGDLPKAWRLYLSAAAKFASDPERASQLTEKAKHVASRATGVVIRVPDPALEGLVVSINGREVEPQRFIRDLAAPGEIVLAAKATDRVSWRRTVQGRAGESIEVELDLPLRGDGATVPPITSTQRRRSRVYLSLGLGVAAVGALAGSYFVAKSASDEYDEIRANPMYCTPQGCTLQGDALIDDTQRKADIATGIGIAGGVLAVGAVIIYLTAPRDTIDTIVTPTATANSGGVTLTGRF